MIVRKVRNQNKVGRVIITCAEYELVKKLGISPEEYIKQALIDIAKRRRWKWFFERANAYEAKLKEKNT